MKYCKLIALFVVLVGCGEPAKEPKKEVVPRVDGTVVSNEPQETAPVFSLATSEYPSWSTFIVAGKANLINPKQGGKPGRLEEKWNVDVVLEVKDYEPCLTLYGSGGVDAVCMTNIDALNPTLSRPGTAVIPTSRSVGGDKIIAVGVKDIEDLKNYTIYGAEKSVSQFVVWRGLEKLGHVPENYKFANLSPGAAATALQTGSDDVKAICVWNPFALQTLRTNKDAKVIFDSSALDDPEEVIDMVVVATESLKKPGGDRFACCICETFYAICKKLADPKTEAVTVKALGEDFSNLSAEDMRICLKDTKFYSTPEEGIKLFKDEDFSDVMLVVWRTDLLIGILDINHPMIKTMQFPTTTVGFGDSSKNLNFDTQYMSRVAGK